MKYPAHDPNRDLAFERHIDLRPPAVWAAWTQPELLLPWFCPRPWTAVACEIDLRPGGSFRTVLRSPEGKEFDNLGCYLEIVPERRLAWTNALGPGFRPVPARPDAGFFFTAIVSLAPEGGGTRYGARVVHGSPEDRDKHAAMGFEAGWSQALEQLVESVQARENAGLIRSP